MIKPLGDRVVIRVLEQEEKRPAAFSCPTRQRKNRAKVKLWL